MHTPNKDLNLVGVRDALDNGPKQTTTRPSRIAIRTEAQFCFNFAIYFHIVMYLESYKLLLQTVQVI